MEEDPKKKTKLFIPAPANGYDTKTGHGPAGIMNG